MTSPNKSSLVLGGTSDIGRATALAFAARGWTVWLAGRDVDALQREADDIAARHRVTVSVHPLDVLATESLARFVDGLPELPDCVVSVIGLRGEQMIAQDDLVHATNIIRSNFEGPALILGIFAERFIRRGAGVIVGVSSVAGDRGRKTNYVYGSAKAGFSAFLSGLRNRCTNTGVHVATIKPGFVRSRMTDGIDLPPLLTAEPTEVGEAIVLAAEKRRNVVYVRPIWRAAMYVVRAIPEFIFKRLSI